MNRKASANVTAMLLRAVPSIVAAGTASHPRPDDIRGHNLIIDIFEDDTAVLEMRFFSAHVEKTEATRSYEIDTIQDVRFGRHPVFRRVRGYVLTFGEDAHRHE
jgi:hypothetical protein